VTPVDTAAARELAGAATPGPWILTRPNQCCSGFCVINDDGDGSIHNRYACTDLDFVAAARDLVPAMADEIDSLRALNAELQAALKYSNNAREIMRQEKEHGWQEAEKFEDRATHAEAQVKRVLDVCDQYVFYCYPSPVGDSSPDRVVLVEDIRRAVGDTR
jgi:hypothetical protein